MGWQDSVPIGTTKIKDSPTIFTGNWTALNNIWNVEHATFASTGSGSHLPGRCGVMYVGTTAQIGALTTPPLGSIAWDSTLEAKFYYTGAAWLEARSFHPGTKMLFYQDVAPVGWTIQNTLDDKLVYITKGGAATGQNGGTVHTVGSWTISGLSATIDSHTLTVAEMPAHNHSGTYAPTQSATVLPNFPGGGHTSAFNGPCNVVAQGGGGGHSHTGSASQNGTWRPAAYCCIICSKN